MAKAKSERKRKRGKIFIIALAALIFAETGYILATTGIGPMLFGWGPPAPSFSDVLRVSQAYVFFNGNVTVEKPPEYQTAYVYVLPYQPGVVYPDQLIARIALDASQSPVYVVPYPVTSAAVVPSDFYELLPTDAKFPVVLLAPNPNNVRIVYDWASGEAHRLGLSVDLTRSSYVIRFQIVNGTIKSAIIV